jgi:hypothetical protein
MFEKEIEIQAGQSLTLLELAADTLIAGDDGAAAIVRMEAGQDEDVSVEPGEAGPVLSVRRACEVQVPAGVPVVVRQAKGNLRARELSSLNAEQVRGNLKLSEVEDVVLAEVYGHLKAGQVGSLHVVGTVHGEATLGEVKAADLQNVRGNLSANEMETLRASRINGSLTAKEISGALDVDQVGGNAALKEIGGPVHLDHVAGNVAAKELTAGARVARIGGNLALSGALRSGCTYQFAVGGNAAVRLEEEASVHVTLKAGGRLASSVALAYEQRTEHTLSGTLGGGGAELAVECGGNAALGGHEAERERGHAFEAEMARQVEESLRAIDLEGVGRQVSQEMEAAMARLRAKMETMDWEQMGRRAQEAVERAMERMQHEMDRWAERAAHRQERVERQAEREARRAARWERRFQGGAAAAAGVSAMDAEAGLPDGPPPVPQPQPSSEQEQLAILKMVEQGQVTPEEAAMLLDALA